MHTESKLTEGESMASSITMNHDPEPPRRGLHHWLDLSRSRLARMLARLGDV